MATRGRFGGKIHAGLLTVSIEIPNLELEIDINKLTRAVGHTVAANVRKRLKAGLDGDGSPLPAPQADNSPFDRTGELIKSIKYYPKMGMVAPSTWTRQGVGRRARSNFGLMSILIANVFTRKGKAQNSSRPDPTDPMGSMSPKTREIIEKAAAKELARQANKGETKVVNNRRSKRARS